MGRMTSSITYRFAAYMIPEFQAVYMPVQIETLYLVQIYPVVNFDSKLLYIFCMIAFGKGRS